MNVEHSLCALLLKEQHDAVSLQQLAWFIDHAPDQFTTSFHGKWPIHIACRNRYARESASYNIQFCTLIYTIPRSLQSSDKRHQASGSYASGRSDNSLLSNLATRLPCMLHVDLMLLSMLFASFCKSIRNLFLLPI